MVRGSVTEFDDFDSKLDVKDPNRSESSRGMKDGSVANCFDIKEFKVESPDCSSRRRKIDSGVFGGDVKAPARSRGVRAASAVL